MEKTRRLFLIFHGRYPSEKAASLFAAKSAEAFAALGLQTTLVVPRRFGRFTVSDREYYGITHDFDVVYLSTIDLFRVPIFRTVAFRVSLFFFSIATWVYLRLHAAKSDIVYSNETLPLLFASFVTKRITYEMHDYPGGFKFYYDFFFDRVENVIVTNRQKIAKLEATFPHAAVRAVYEPNAVALEVYQAAPDRAGSRQILGLPAGKIVVYTGHLYSWKGVDTLAAAAHDLDAQVYIVGGTKRDVASYTTKWGSVPNLHILGHRPFKEMVLWQKAADVVVLPNTGKEDISVEYTSPMKLFEYMASGTPIVASDLPSIREIVGAGRAILVTPDDPQALARGIHSVLDEGGTSNSERALEWVKDHTWEKRAARILEKIQ